jgi:enoyl-CoA hydratase/carnithine racemase
MQGPAEVLRSNEISKLENLGPLHEWVDGKSYLIVDRVRYDGKQGVVFTYNNPPVHQMGNPALDAYLAAFDKLAPMVGELEFLLLNGAPDPVHAGGDLKESLRRLRDTQEKRAELEAKGADQEEIDALYNWGDKRLDKGFALYEAVTGASKSLRTVAVCAGGARFGGSAEVPLLADVLVGDSRSSMCFSESMIGLIPGWGGVGRAITKAGVENARAMSMTCPMVKASDLKAVGIYNEVVDISYPLPRKQRTDDPASDKERFKRDLAEHCGKVAIDILPVALDLAIADQFPTVSPSERKTLKSRSATDEEVERRANPMTYEGLWDKPLREVKGEIKELGRPLAPQSIAELEELFATVDEGSFDEESFIRRESKADGRLYRDPRFMQGILATLEQKVADFREVD